MKVLYQWALKDPTGWQEIDSTLWSTLPTRAVPKSGQLGGQNNTPGWLRNVSVQGITAEGYDHVAIEPITVGLDTGVKYTVWNDDPDDYPVGERQAIVWTVLPLAPDPKLGMAINTRQSCVRYCEGARYARLLSSPPQNTTIRPWGEFTQPLATVTRHGVWLSDAKLTQHIAQAPQAEWSWHHWCDHLPQSETETETQIVMDDGQVKTFPTPRRKLKEQRVQGRYRQAEHTITYYQGATASQGWVVASSERYLRLTTTTAATQSVTTDAAAVQAYAFATNDLVDGGPDSADWPSGVFHAQLNCTAASTGLTYGIGNSSNAAGFVRVSSDLTTVLDSTSVSNGSGDINDFSGTGLKLATSPTWDSAAGNVGDHFGFRVMATGDSHGDAITIQVNTSDSYADGPWTVGAQTVKTKKGLAIASVKTAKGLAIASVKTMKGLSTT